MNAVSHRVLHIDLGQLGGSALTDSNIAVPTAGVQPGIPVTYVPARNTVLLSLALAWAEVLGARDIFVGVNAVDYSGYPDCRPEFLEAFTTMANLGTKAGVTGKTGFTIHAPLLYLSKKEIIEKGVALGIDYSLTHSCYDPKGGKACGRCDSCLLRLRGFSEAGIKDPAAYVREPPLPQTGNEG